MGKENLHIFRGELALALAVIINSFGYIQVREFRLYRVFRMRFRRLFRKYRSERGHIFFKDCLF